MSMYGFSNRSKQNLALVHPDLIGVMYRVIYHEDCPFDFAITEGARAPERQKQLVAIGASWTMDSRHLIAHDETLGGQPMCHAVDVAVFYAGQVRWEFDLYRQLADFVLEQAGHIGVEIEWGGDWQTRDGPHFQLSADQYPRHAISENDIKLTSA